MSCWPCWRWWWTTSRRPSCARLQRSSFRRSIIPRLTMIMTLSARIVRLFYSIDGRYNKRIKLYALLNVPGTKKMTMMLQSIWTESVSQIWTGNDSKEMCRLQDTLISFEEFVQIMDTSDVEHKMSMKFVGWVNIVLQGVYMIKGIKEMRWIIMYIISGHCTAFPPKTGPKLIQNIYSCKSGRRSWNS